MELNVRDEASRLSKEIHIIWNIEKLASKYVSVLLFVIQFLLTKLCRPSIVKTLWRLVWRNFAKAGIYKVGNDIFLFVGPLVLHSVIGFLQNPGEPLWIGVS